MIISPPACEGRGQYKDTDCACADPLPKIVTQQKMKAGTTAVRRISPPLRKRSGTVRHDTLFSKRALCALPAPMAGRTPHRGTPGERRQFEIGRASCRERC